MSPSGARELGRVFLDAEVVRNYRYRQPYPTEVFQILEGLLVAPRTVLDVGSGTGALTIGLARFAERVDAIDPSAAMIREARGVPGGDSERIRWTLGTAETAPLDPPYGLVTAGASIHWMDPEVVMRRFRAALAPGARLAIVDMENVHPQGPHRDEFLSVIRRHSALEHHDDFVGLLTKLERDGHFAREGDHRTRPVPFEQSVDDYMAMLASTSSLSRATLGDRSDAFEAEARAVLSRHHIDRIRFDVVGMVAWGLPLA
ncbi:MAG: class I SAM-dependent methyltransferase [Chloroflexi bacterium]|nr:MAG: class I SAM-dependent methyltransferase [Chloroflexota bacterium]